MSVWRCKVVCGQYYLNCRTNDTVVQPHKQTGTQMRGGKEIIKNIYIAVLIKYLVGCRIINYLHS